MKLLCMSFTFSLLMDTEDPNLAVVNCAVASMDVEIPLWRVDVELFRVCTQKRHRKKTVLTRGMA